MNQKKEDPFNIDDYPELAWLKGFRIEGYPDIIRVPFRIPPFQLEFVPASIERYEKGHFTCTVLCEPKMDCKIKKGILLMSSILCLKECTIFDVRQLRRGVDLGGGDGESHLFSKSIHANLYDAFFYFDKFTRIFIPHFGRATFLPRFACRKWNFFE